MCFAGSEPFPAGGTLSPSASVVVARLIRIGLVVFGSEYAGFLAAVGADHHHFTPARRKAVSTRSRLQFSSLWMAFLTWMGSSPALTLAL